MRYPTSDEIRIVKKIIKKSYSAFFGSFGAINNLQIRSIPLIYSGKNIIIHSPSASGKTEAAVVPIAEKMAADKEGGLQLIYIAPTKALVNDIYRRLSQPLRKLNISLTFKTMDKPKINLKKSENFLITTPESFDSLLCRHPDVFIPLRYIILDELHLLDGGVRGDQLRILIERVTKITKNKLQFIALSATLFNPLTVANRYFENPTVVEEDGTKRLNLNLFENIEKSIAFMKKNRLNKVLFFANSRREVEEVADLLKKYWPKDRILVHHGSLAKKERFTAEKCMQEWKWGICVATTTLEIGIDIGDISAVGFISPPPLPSAFHQRAGRGCRRENSIEVIAIYKNETEKELFLNYYRLYSQSEVEETKYEIDISILIQQLFSIIYGKRSGVNISELNDIFIKFFSDDTIKRILSHLIGKEYIINRGTKLYPTEWLLEFGYMGRIHSNIDTEREYKLFEQKTGSFIGNLKLKPREGENIIFSGKIWRVAQIYEKKIFVTPSTHAKSKNLFGKRSDKGFFARFLPSNVSHS